MKKSTMNTNDITKDVIDLVFNFEKEHKLLEAVVYGYGNEVGGGHNLPLIMEKCYALHQKEEPNCSVCKTVTQIKRKLGIK